MKSCNIKYYAITCRKAHCKAGHVQFITFAVAAKNIVEAIEIAKHFPGVKHTNKAVIIEAKSITLQEYEVRRKQSAYY